MTKESYATMSLKPIAGEVESRKVVPRAVYWFKRGAFWF